MKMSSASKVKKVFYGLSAISGGVTIFTTIVNKYSKEDTLKSSKLKLGNQLSMMFKFLVGSHQLFQIIKISVLIYAELFLRHCHFLVKHLLLTFHGILRSPTKMQFLRQFQINM